MAENEFMDLATFLNSRPNYSVNAENEVFHYGELVAEIFMRKNFSSHFLEKNKIFWKDIISRELRPIEAIFVKDSNTVFIIEKRSQNESGSTDEKLGACAFKRKQYEKLLQGRCNLKMIYLLSNWFNDPKYRDVLMYINSEGCYYYFDDIPFEIFELSSH